jgi:hypothetical protein
MLILKCFFFSGGSRQNYKGISKASEKEKKIGHRRVNEEGEVSYKKIQTNQLMASIQLGIQYSISRWADSTIV